MKLAVVPVRHCAGTGRVVIVATAAGYTTKLTVSDAAGQTLGDPGVTVSLAQYAPGASTTAVVLQLPGSVNRGLDPAGWQ